MYEALLEQHFHKVGTTPKHESTAQSNTTEVSFSLGVQENGARPVLQALGDSRAIAASMLVYLKQMGRMNPSPSPEPANGGLRMRALRLSAISYQPHSSQRFCPFHGITRVCVCACSGWGWGRGGILECAV